MNNLWTIPYKILILCQWKSKITATAGQI